MLGLGEMKYYFKLGGRILMMLVLVLDFDSCRVGNGDLGRWYL